MFNKEKIINEIKLEVKNHNKQGVITLLRGDVLSFILATLSKEAFPNNSMTLLANIETTQIENRNSLRTIDSVKSEDIRINLDEEFQAIIKKTFEIKDIYRDPETYNEYLKTGNAPVDDSYLNDENFTSYKESMKEDIKLASLYGWANKKNYFVLNTIGDYSDHELIDIAKELNIPEMILKTLENNNE